MQQNTSGAQNVAFGWNSLKNNTTSNDNTAVGANSLNTNITGNGNSALGEEALFTTTGSYNSSVGRSSLYDLTTGTYNTGMGQNAGVGLTTGSYNIAIGISSALFSNTGSYQLNIGNAIYGDTYMKRIGINKTSPTTTLEVVGTVSATNINLGTPSSAAGTNPVCWDSTSKALSYSTACTASDIRLKKDIQPLTGSLDPAGAFLQDCLAVATLMTD